MVFGLLGGSAMLATAIAVSSSGAPGLIDDADLISVIEDQCAQMTSTVESMPVVGPPKRQAATIAHQNEAIGMMLGAIRDLGPDVIASDPPTNEWLGDWERLVEAREAYAEEILDGSLPDLEIPNDENGDDIDLRMDDVFIDGSTCEVPDVLLNPYPDDESEA